MRATIILVSLLLSTQIFAKQLDFEQKSLERPVEKAFVDTNYNTISEVSIEEVRGVEFLDSLNTVNTGIQQVIKITDSLIALGKKIWPLIEAGRPVINTNFADYITVIPNVGGDTDIFGDLYGWSAPVSKKYKVNYKNLYGVSVASFTFSVNAQYGGEYDGKGAYLSGVTIVPNNISVAWGYDFDAESTMINITNRGSKNDPIAAVNLEVSYVVKTVLKETRVKTQFHVAGNGEIIQIN